jgi:hypothetical protein
MSASSRRRSCRRRWRRCRSTASASPSTSTCAIPGSGHRSREPIRPRNSDSGEWSRGAMLPQGPRDRPSPRMSTRDEPTVCRTVIERPIVKSDHPVGSIEVTARNVDRPVDLCADVAVGLGCKVRPPDCRAPGRYPSPGGGRRAPTSLHSFWPNYRHVRVEHNLRFRCRYPAVDLCDRRWHRFVVWQQHIG